MFTAYPWRRTPGIVGVRLESAAPEKQVRASHVPVHLFWGFSVNVRVIAHAFVVVNLWGARRAVLIRWHAVPLSFFSYEINAWPATGGGEMLGVGRHLVSFCFPKASTKAAGYSCQPTSLSAN